MRSEGEAKGMRLSKLFLAELQWDAEATRARLGAS